MSCIVGVAESITERGRVWIGADSYGAALGDNWHVGEIRTDRKVFMLGGEMAIGFTTSFRMGQILRYHLKLEPHNTRRDGMSWPEQVESAEEWLVVHFVNAVRKALKDGGWATKKDEREEGGQFLIGYEGVIWMMDADFQIGRTAIGYNAIGSGQQFALGALHVLNLLATDDAGARAGVMVRGALDAAAAHSPYVRAPFHLVSASP